MAITLMIKNGDITTSSANGRPITISGATKFNQDAQEFLTIGVQPTGFGSGIEELVGVLADTGSTVTALIDRQITDGIAEWRAIQVADSSTPRTTDERILGATNIESSQVNSDETEYVYTVNFVTESGKSILGQVGGDS